MTALRKRYSLLLNGRRAALSTVLLAVLAIGTSGSVRAAEFDRQEVEAAFLLNFAKFTTWPQRHDTELVLGILGEDPFGPALQLIKGRPVKGARLLVRQVSTLEEARGCDVLFIAASESPRLAEILRCLRREPVLTISDLPGFIEQGGMIGLLEQERRIRFAINLEAVQYAALSLNAQLLDLAFEVRTERKHMP
jgi:YfiR/HmsC-like